MLTRTIVQKTDIMIKLIADSTCDLPDDVIEKYDIDILPLHIVLGEKEYLDVFDISPDEIFAWVEEHDKAPKTSAISIKDTIETFSYYKDTATEIICFSISDKLSSTGNIMRLAAEELDMEDQIHVVNSDNLSCGIGILIMETIGMIEEGLGVSKIITELEKMKTQVKTSFVIDTLTYLHRGGRCSSIEAFAGNMIKLHPQIIVEDGCMSASKKYRGKMNAVIKSYVRDVTTKFITAKTKNLFIASVGCDKEIVEWVYEEIKRIGLFENIYIAQAGGVISSHCGPGTLGIFYIDE